jgi:hypothetical protein
MWYLTSKGDDDLIAPYFSSAFEPKILDARDSVDFKTIKLEAPNIYQNR